MFEDDNEIIDKILEQKQEELIRKYLKIQKKYNANNKDIYREIEKLDNIDNDTKERITKLLAEYLDQNNIEVAKEIKFYYATGFKDGAKIILEILGKG